MILITAMNVHKFAEKRLENDNWKMTSNMVRSHKEKNRKVILFQKTGDQKFPSKLSDGFSFFF